MDERAKLNMGENSTIVEKKAKWEGKDDLICSKSIMGCFSFLLGQRFK